jgi:excisionase family DNA binding protein
MNNINNQLEKALLITDDQAAALLGLSRSTFWRRVADRSLPRPLRIGGATRWRRQEIEAFVQTLADKRDASAKRGRA